MDNFTKKDFFSKLKVKCPDDEEIERTKKIIRNFNLKNWEELPHLYLKRDVLLLASVFEKFIKVSFDEFDNNPLCCVSLPGYIWQCGLKHTGTNLQTVQDKDMVLLFENNIGGGISSIMGNRYVESNDNKRVLFIDANNLYGNSMPLSLLSDESKYDRNKNLEAILNT